MKTDELYWIAFGSYAVCFNTRRLPEHAKAMSPENNGNKHTICAPDIITKTKTCTIYTNQRTLTATANEETNTKQNIKNNSVLNKIHEILGKICCCFLQCIFRLERSSELGINSS